MTRDDVLCYLDKYRKPENEDPLHKWIGTYNIRRVILSRFFKWLHYPEVEDPKRRSELSALEKKPACIMGIKQLKLKETSCYKPSDLWSQEDDLVFLKWVTNKRDRWLIAIINIPLVTRHLFASVIYSCQFLPIKDNKNIATSKASSANGTFFYVTGCNIIIYCYMVKAIDSL
jgi:hypothetical protein